MSADPVSATEVELTIRCALQTFEDKAIKVPIDWKVQELKAHLHEACPTKPVSSLYLLFWFLFPLSVIKEQNCVLHCRVCNRLA